MDFEEVGDDDDDCFEAGREEDEGSLYGRFSPHSLDFFTKNWDTIKMSPVEYYY